jgi:hypothetical protein
MKRTNRTAGRGLLALAGCLAALAVAQAGIGLAAAQTAPAAAAPAQPPAPPPPEVALPAEVAGIALPQTPLARRAAAFVHQAEPEFLFNHSVRTYLFGALRLNARHMSYDAETAFVAALFHDLGLIPQYASPNASFEVDGANRAEAFLRDNGAPAAAQRMAWNAVAMHDMGRVFESHQGPEALLLGAGAGSDVDGPDPAAIPPATVATVLAAFPRRGFKVGFTALAVDHCRRKPTSQAGWLDNLCREVSPNAERDSVREEIAGSSFSE